MAVQRRRAARGWSGWAALALALVGAALLAVGGYLFARPPAVRAAAIPGPAVVSPSGTESPPPPSGGDGGSAPAGTNDGARDVAPGPPASVSFPGQGIAAAVDPVGVLDSGALQLPEDPARVGWWAGGAVAGAPTGTTVLAGHMDGRHQSGAMRALLHVAQGDAVDVTDGLGHVHAYRVVSRETTPWNHLDRSLFTTTGPPRLALITCGGTFDAGSGRYLDNVVVLAEPMPGSS